MRWRRGRASSRQSTRGPGRPFATRFAASRSVPCSRRCSKNTWTSTSGDGGQRHAPAKGDSFVDRKLVLQAGGATETEIDRVSKGNGRGSRNEEMRDIQQEDVQALFAVDADAPVQGARLASLPEFSDPRLGPSRWIPIGRIGAAMSSLRSAISTPPHSPHVAPAGPQPSMVPTLAPLAQSAQPGVVFCVGRGRASQAAEGCVWELWWPKSAGSEARALPMSLILAPREDISAGSDAQGGLEDTSALASGVAGAQSGPIAPEPQVEEPSSTRFRPARAARAALAGADP